MQTRYIPPNSTKVENKSGSAVAYLYTGSKSGVPCAVGYAGKANKPSLHFRYRDETQRAASVAQFLRNADDNKQDKANRKEEHKAKMAQPHNLAVGDVLVCSWGYDQTNVDYYEVTRLVGRRQVEIREIACQSEERGFMQGQSVPAPGHYTGKPMVKLVNEYNRVRIASYATAGKLEQIKVAGVKVFQPQSWTAYA